LGWLLQSVWVAIWLMKEAVRIYVKIRPATKSAIPYATMLPVTGMAEIVSLLPHLQSRAGAHLSARGLGLAMVNVILNGIVTKQPATTMIMTVKQN